MQKLLLCLLLFLVSYTVLLRADTLYLRNGKTLEGVFLGVQKGYYKFKVQGGEIRCVPRLELDDLRTEQDPSKIQPLAKDEGDEIVCGEKQEPKEEEKKEEKAPDLSPVPVLPIDKIDKPPIPKTPSVPEGGGVKKDELESDPQNKKEKPKLEGSPKEELQPKPKDEKKIPKLEGEAQKEPVPKPKPQIEKEIPKLEGSPKEEL